MGPGPILIVDDNPANLKVARLALECEGYEVHTAGDGEQALLALKTLRPCLILMDLQLPGMSGLELTRRLKADPATRDILVVAVTAYAMKGDREKALLAGCNGYITKPVDPIQLPSEIAALIGPGLKMPPDVEQPEAAPRHGGSTMPTRGTVLVVEDNPTTHKLFSFTLSTAGFEVLEAFDGASALESIRARRPDLIVQDLGLPDFDGVELSRLLRAEPGGAEVPIICVTGFLSRVDDGRALKQGFVRALVKPVDPQLLLDAVVSHVAAVPPPLAWVGAGRKVLIADDDPSQRKVERHWFRGAGFEVVEASDGEEALAIARRERPSLIVSDVLMPKADGFELCANVRGDPELAGTPVVLVSSAYVEHADAELARQVGADALVRRSGGLEEVLGAVASALEPSRSRPAASVADRPPGQRTERALWQLERQVERNATLERRLLFQEAAVAVLAGVADALATRRVLADVLGEVFASCLDMAGISKGAVFLFEEARLSLAHQVGFSVRELPQLESLFGQTELISEIARAEKPVQLPSQAVPEKLSRAMVVDAGVTSVLVVPITWAHISYGAMIFGARTADLTHPDALAFVTLVGAEIAQAIVVNRAFAQLSANERRYRALTENAEDAIFVTDASGRLREVNRKFCELLGFNTAELVGRPLHDFEPPMPAPGATGGHPRAPAEPKTGRSLSLTKKDGSLLPLELSSAEIDLGGVPMQLSIGRDVSEQLRAQAQLMMSDRMASVGALAASVAHEINNPLAALLANLDMAAQDAAALSASAAAPADLEQSIADARHAARRVQAIVKDLRVFSRGDDEQRGWVDVHQVLDSTLRMARNEIHHRAELVTRYEARGGAFGNESRLGQVFLNLVINAAQAIPEGQADRNQITVTTRDAGERVVVEVRDTGVGMSKEVLGRLFTPFFTTKPAKTGTGLGLVICQRIIRELGGEVSVESEPGVGSVFRVSLLPAAAVLAPVAEAPPNQAAVRRGSVLLVDDEPMMGPVVRRALSAEHDVSVFGAAQLALDAITSGARFDVILCDMMMPVISGIDFYQRLEAISGEQAARVIFLTGGVFTERAHAFLDRSDRARLDKPFELAKLRSLVNARVR